MDNSNQNTEKQKDTVPEGLTSEHVHGDEPSADTPSAKSSAPEATSQQTRPEEKTDQQHQTEASSTLLGSLASGDWAALKKQVARTADSALSYLPDLSGITMPSERPAAAPTTDLTATPADRPAEAPAAAAAESGILSRTFNFLSDSVSSFFGGDKSNTVEGQLASGRPVSEDTGFRWDNIGQSVRNLFGTAMTAAESTASALFGGQQSVFAFSTAAAGSQFKFDGYQKPGDTSTTSSSSASGDFFGFVSRGIGYLSDAYNNVKDNLTDFFWGGDQTGTDASAAQYANETDAELEADLLGGDRNKGARVERTSDGVTVTNDNATVTTNTEGTTVRTNDGRVVKEGSDGTTTATSPNSNLGLEKQKDGSILVKDKNSGETLYRFSNRGDAERFFDNGGVIGTTRPNETVEQAAERMQNEVGPDGKKVHENKSIIVTDGNGNVLAIDEHGNRIRHFPDGRTEMAYRRQGPDGSESIVQVRAQRRGEGTVVQVKVGGQYIDTANMTPEQRRQVQEALRGSDLSLRQDEHGQYHIHRRKCHHDESASPASEPETQRLVGERGEIQVADSATVGPDGTIRAQSGGQEVTVTHNPDSPPGTITITEQTPGQPASRTTTIDEHRHVHIQGNNPDGTPNPGDVIDYNRDRQEVSAWDVDGDGQGDIIMGPHRHTHIGMPDGTAINLNDDGSFDFLDEDGTPWYSSSEDEAFQEYLREYYDECDDDIEHVLAEQRGQQAESAAESVEAQLKGMSNYMAPGALEGAISAGMAALAELQEHGLPTGSLQAAIDRLRALRSEFASQQSLQNQIYARAGTINDTLVRLAFASGLRGDAAADAAVKNFYGRRDQTQNA